MILGGTQETISRAIHEEYVRAELKKGNTPENNLSMAPWEDLPETLKESNRHQAGHIGHKLNVIRCGVIPIMFPADDNFQFTPEEIEQLAIMEHDRWMEERLAAGWRYGKEKNVQEKISPYLVPWEELKEDIRQLDRNTVTGLPVFLGKVGLGVYRMG
jgi:hypothetical protein